MNARIHLNFLTQEVQEKQYKKKQTKQKYYRRRAALMTECVTKYLCAIGI